MTCLPSVLVRNRGQKKINKQFVCSCKDKQGLLCKSGAPEGRQKALPITLQRLNDRLTNQQPVTKIAFWRNYKSFTHNYNHTVSFTVLQLQTSMLARTKQNVKKNKNNRPVSPYSAADKSVPDSEQQPWPARPHLKTAAQLLPSGKRPPGPDAKRSPHCDAMPGHRAQRRCPSMNDFQCVDKDISCWHSHGPAQFAALTSLTRFRSSFVYVSLSLSICVRVYCCVQR